MAGGSHQVQGHTERIPRKRERRERKPQRKGALKHEVTGALPWRWKEQRTQEKRNLGKIVNIRSLILVKVIIMSIWKAI